MEEVAKGSVVAACNKMYRENILNSLRGIETLRRMRNEIDLPNFGRREKRFIIAFLIGVIVTDLVDTVVD